MKLRLLHLFLFLGTSISFPSMILAQNTSIEVLTKQIRQGADIEVRVNSDKKLDSKAWVGIFELNAGDRYKTYEYVENSKNGIIKLKAPIAVGAYELKLYDTDPGNVIQRKEMKVIATQPNEYNITVVTKEINPSLPFKVQIQTDFETDKNAWIGIFRKETPKDEITYISYKYVANSTETTIELTAPSNPGDYTLRFYSSDPGALIHQLPFRVGNPDVPGIGFSINKKVFEATEEITLNYTGHENLTESAWIGMYKANTKEDTYDGYLTYFYLKPKLKGVLTFKAPTTKGKYKFRLFYAETGPQLLEAVPFEVSNSLDDTSLRKTLDTKGKVTLYGIYFDTDKSIIKSESYPLIEEIAKMLNADIAVKIQIEGHTDAQGDDAYNQTLSEKRAAAVAKLLIEKYRVSKSQLQHKGFGETKPIDDNNTASGRAKNRRVELKKIN